MRLKLRLQRCQPGRNVRMHHRVEDSMVGVGMEVAGGAMITIHKVAVEDMKEEGGGTGTGEVEGEVAEEERCRGAWETEAEAEGGEAVIIRDIIKMEVVRGEGGEGVMEGEGTTRAASKTLATMEEEVTMTTTTKMEIGIRRGVVLAGLEGDGEGEAEEEEGGHKEGAGGAEGGSILTKEDSSNSSSNMAGSTTTRLASVNSNTTPVKDPPHTHTPPCPNFLCVVTAQHMTGLMTPP